MSIAYETFAAGETNIKFATDRRLVLGFMTIDREAHTERRYALHQDGRVFESGAVQMPHSIFDDKRVAWTKVDAVPADAEFIGHYPPSGRYGG